MQEEKALKEYREALTLKQQKHFQDAEELLLNLVNSSLLSEEEGQVGFIGGRIQPSLLHLKYGCFINLGSINAEANNLEEALEYYVKAIELDSTDINIWYKIGKIALDIHNLDLAVQAFNNVSTYIFSRPPHEVHMFKDSPDPLRWTEDTMDLIAMFDDLEDVTSDSTGELSALFVQRLSEGERNTVMSGYFSSPDREGADVSTFLSLHSGQNILNLFLAYLRSLCSKWNILWPTSLKSLYCTIFNTVSAHFSSGRFRVGVDRIEDEHTSASDDSAELLRTNTMVLVLFGELTLNACIEKGEFLRNGEEKELFPSLLFQGKVVWFFGGEGLEGRILEDMEYNNYLLDWWSLQMKFLCA
ncbi:hypothetical protein WDU94_001449 [Cyamophila willieti]